MKVYTNEVIALDEELRARLSELRERRAFNAERWIERKVELINAYFRESGLRGAVLGLSGGIDSSVACALMARAMRAPGSVLERVVPLALPALGSEGASTQDEAVARAREVAESLALELKVYPILGELTETVSASLGSLLELPESPWTKGQLVAYLRTPLLYNSCSILTEAGIPSLVIGTTNLTEGGYLGYVGKASDGMVDLQIISDLFKSEVYAVARALGLPQSVLDAIPTGDMFDGREDVQVFGATYDFAELYHYVLMGEERPAGELFERGAEHLEALHAYNAHKYLYDSPSVHLDIMPAAIPGGWNKHSWIPTGELKTMDGVR